MASGPPTVAQHLEILRRSSHADLLSLISQIGPELHDKLPRSYVESLPEVDQTICLRAALVLWATRGGGYVPREMQLRAILGDRHRQDVNVTAGTGSGKTLPIALNILLDDPAHQYITITFSPLKRLQESQRLEFEELFGIPTAVINDTTPRDPTWWNENVWNNRRKVPGRRRHLLVTVEQAFKSREGHFPPLYLLLRNPYFARRIVRVSVDEVHSVYTSGTPLYGLPAFRPAWARLPEVKALIPKSVNWSFYTATLPPHIRKVLIQTLIPSKDFVDIFITTNRKNLVYATHCMVKSMDELRNYRCFIRNPFVLDAQPHILIFVDNVNLTTRISSYLRSLLPSGLSGREKIVMHYNSQMSEEYLQSAHQEFTDPKGKCRILVTTSGQSVGVDFPNVEIVCNVGIPPTGVDAIQRGGRGGRQPGSQALFVIFHEPFANEIDLGEYKGRGIDLNDPDRPRNKLKTSSNRRDRAPYFMTQLIQSSECIRRQLNKNYLNDESDESLSFSNKWGLCCDRDHAFDHPEFDLTSLLPGQIFTLEDLEKSKAAEAEVKKTRNKFRPTAERGYLEYEVNKWLRATHKADPTSLVSQSAPHSFR
ncbi:P-loop containing nucleoside triphosphate hydrolase protein [Ephemerocybe angulata]|uniref:DNA 3'-5' helicase n=1 Tax=Ephemerocybe angulata TaxID=980116 RepID=A0A8H6HN14_9AGAR|nr:P-loop containing nucleoside triphosphate hydrolase protein [Tulosesus angulatus]